MRQFDYSKLKAIAWDSEVLSLVAQIHECKGRRKCIWRRNLRLWIGWGDCQGAEYRGFQQDRGYCYHQYPNQAAVRGKNHAPEPGRGRDQRLPGCAEHNPREL